MTDFGEENGATRIVPGGHLMEDRLQFELADSIPAEMEKGSVLIYNGRIYHDGCLNRWAFLSVREARLIVENWRQEYNEERPHGALDQITPAAYAAGVEQENREAA